MPLNDYRLCYIVASVELLHESSTLNTLLINTYIPPKDTFINILKVYAFGEDFDLIEQLIEEFAEENIQTEKYSPYDFMCYYVIPKLWMLFGKNVETILNETYFSEFFVDNVKYSYKNKLTVLIKHNHLDSAIKRYQYFLHEQNINVRKVEKRPFEIVIKNGHASLVFNFK